jgi:hypothetical protein
MKSMPARPAGILAVAALVAAASSGCASANSSEIRTAAGPEVQGGAWFSQTGCTACHSVSVYGLWNPGVTAPDLSVAVEDVPKRFGRPLEDFLKAPTGTMALVLSERIPLTEPERALAIERLKEAYQRHQEQGGVGRTLPSH